MFDFLGPREVADVDKAIYAFLKFYEYTEVSEVANLCSVFAAYSVLLFDVLPWIWLKLLDTEAHLALCTVESKDYGFYFVANLHEILS